MSRAQDHFGAAQTRQSSSTHAANSSWVKNHKFKGEKHAISKESCRFTASSNTCVHTGPILRRQV